ncbi:ammonium transporter [Acinetobacter baumannii]
MKKMLMALSLTGALLGGTAAWAEETVTTPTSEVTATSTSEAPATIAAAPAAEETPAAPTPTAKLDTGDTSWILISTALVLLMTIPGLALFYGGMVRKKNVLSTMMFSLSAAILVSLLWVIAGYSIAFSGTGAYFGDLSKAMLNGVAFDALSGTIPESLFVIFQMTFAIITVAILSGSIADRMKYSAFMAFIAIWVLVVYAPITHWVWAADGWLFKAGALDFAGGTVVHINSGVAGLVAAAAAAFSWLVVERMIRGKASVLGGASGAVAGLVVITPAAGFVGVGGALVMGLIGGVVCFWGITALKRLLKADDALDAFGLHAVGGIVGAILTGVFYSDEIIKAANVALAPTFAGQLWVQVEGVLATMVYSGIATFIILKVIDLIIGLRVNSDDERMGLDLSQHGERIE